jgi:hypothetical protein
MVEQVGLKWVAGGGIERDAGNVFIERPQCLRVAVAADVPIGEHVDLSRHFVAIDAGAEQWRSPDHLDFRQGHGCSFFGRR